MDFAICPRKETFTCRNLTWSMVPRDWRAWCRRKGRVTDFPPSGRIILTDIEQVGTQWKRQVVKGLHTSPSFSRSRNLASPPPNITDNCTKYHHQCNNRARWRLSWTGICIGHAKQVLVSQEFLTLFGSWKFIRKLFLTNKTNPFLWHPCIYSYLTSLI
jgi:hypothetical protein